MFIDPETGMEHISPVGMESQDARTAAGGKYCATPKISHFIIVEHQKEYPELAKQMKDNPTKATAIYTSFLCMLALEVKGKLTDDMKKKILTSFKIIGGKRR